MTLVGDLGYGNGVGWVGCFLFPGCLLRLRHIRANSDVYRDTTLKHKRIDIFLIKKTLLVCE